MQRLFRRFRFSFDVATGWRVHLIQRDNPPACELEAAETGSAASSFRFRWLKAGRGVARLAFAVTIIAGSALAPGQATTAQSPTAQPPTPASHARKHIRHRHKRRHATHPNTAAAAVHPPATAPVAKPRASNTTVPAQAAHAPVAPLASRAVVARTPVTTASVVHRHHVAHVHIVQNANPQAALVTPPAGVQTIAMPVPTEPAVPETPKWPAFDHPASATVTWDSHGLSIDAANSSLKQILKDVAVATGLKVEGLTSDERVFGSYGPGLARDVLSEVLQGSGYNVLMIGDLGQGAPRRILLSIRQASSGQTPAGTVNAQAAGGDDDESDDQPEPEPQETQPIRPGFQPGGPPRTPQQIMQEMQQRQQQMQQEQQQQQPPN